CNDANGNGRRDFGEGGIGGRVIQLIDENGAVVATTTTGADGRYSFDNLTTEMEPATAYRVREVLPGGVVQTTADPAPITFTRGRVVSGVNFGNARSRTRMLSAVVSGASGGAFVTDVGATSGAAGDSSIIAMAQ